MGYFGERKLLDHITEGDAEEYWRYLIGPVESGGAGLSKNTARGHCKNAKTTEIRSITRSFEAAMVELTS
jgi:hypothetical protein